MRTQATTANGGETRLGELLDDGLFVDGDWVESKDQDPNGDVRLIQLADVGDGDFRDRSSRFLTSAKARELGCTLLEPGDILVARMPEPLGRACLFPGMDRPAVTAVDICIIRPNPSRVRREWLVKAINSPVFRAAMQEFIRGTTRQRISRKNLGSIRLAVPSIDEQAEIALLLDALDRTRSSAASHVVAARHAVETFRQATLAAALSGRMTSDWRESHADSSGQAVLEGLRADTSPLKGRKGGRPLEDHPHPATELPDTWEWARLSELATSIEYGYTAPSSVDAVGPKMLRITDIQDDAVDWARVPHCEISDDKAVGYRLRDGDLVFARTGATTGKSFLVRDAPPDSVFASYLIRVRLKVGIDPDYVYAFFRSPRYWQQVSDASSGTGQPNVNGTKLASLWVPVPGSDEQGEIVRRLDKQLGVASAVSGRVEAARVRVSSIARAMLAKDFRGYALSASNGSVGQ